MRIGIDARKIADTGIGRHIENLVSNLLKIGGDHEYILFMAPDDIENYDYPDERVTKVAEKAGKYTIAEHRAMADNCHIHKLDLYHAPHYVMPLTLKCRSVVTIHDLIHIIEPSFGYVARNYARWMIRSAVKRADRIITVSECTKKHLIDIGRAESMKIRVIHNGGGDFSRLPEDELGRELEKIGVTPGYFLFVGSDRPHKNMAAVAGAMDKMPPDTIFVIVGRAGEEAKGPFARFEGRAVFVNGLGKQEMSALYSGAQALLFPSRHEGFGLPPLEAMACGTPVVASNCSSIPEVTGDAAVGADPADHQAMAEALIKIGNDAEFRASLVEKGYERVKQFSWEKMARATMEVYMEATR